MSWDINRYSMKRGFHGPISSGSPVCTVLPGRPVMQISAPSFLKTPRTPKWLCSPSIPKGSPQWRPRPSSLHPRMGISCNLGSAAADKAKLSLYNHGRIQWENVQNGGREDLREGEGMSALDVRRQTKNFLSFLCNFRMLWLQVICMILLFKGGHEALKRSSAHDHSSALKVLNDFQILDQQ